MNNYKTTEEQINKTIAEYMDEMKCCHTDEFFNYCSSLDLLVPVVEKLGYVPIFCKRTGRKGWGVSFKKTWMEHIISYADTMPLALATACAKVINEHKISNTCS